MKVQERKKNVKNKNNPLKIKYDDKKDCERSY